MDASWTPLGADTAGPEVLHEGLPKWMELRFWAWLDESAEQAAQSTASGALAELMVEFDERYRLSAPLAPRCHYYPVSEVLSARDDSLALSVADFVLARTAEQDQDDTARTLEDVLHRSGSAWTVGQRLGELGLERRVSTAVQAASDAVMSSTGDAGKLLSEAWHAAFGMNPDPEKAYSKAIKAVEEAAKPRVSPNDSVATLGKMVSAMRDQKDWALPLQDDERNPSSDTVVKMMRSLHSGQQQRHGGNGDRSATQEEAEAALFLAVPLVQFFQGGLVARRS